MTTVQVANLVSSLFGAAGTTLLFFFSYTYIPLGGGAWGGPTLDAANAKTSAKNVIWKRKQRVGFGLLCVSFVIQAAAVFL
jgi:hypothetical protein